MLPHQARNHGAAMAEGDVLVFTDPDCVAAPDWLERLISHHVSGRHVVGGGVRGLPDWWDRSVHVTKYGWWLPESPGGSRTQLPSGNLSISRHAWEKLEGFQGEFFAGDSELCWRIRQAGIKLWFDPDAVVTHLEHPGPLAFVRERFHRGRDFGQMRVRAENWGRLRCLFYLLGLPVLPCVMTLRTARFAFRGGYASRWLEALPVQLAGNGLWCLGEAFAHLACLGRG